MLDDYIVNVAENNVMSLSEIEQQLKLIVSDSIEYTCRSIIFDRPHLFTVHFPNILDWVATWTNEFDEKKKL
jgi:hypothetical protein